LTELFKKIKGGRFLGHIVCAEGCVTQSYLYV